MLQTLTRLTRAIQFPQPKPLPLIVLFMLSLTLTEQANAYYSPSMGRFTSRDPIHYPDGPNTYAGWFAPIRLDPAGLQSAQIRSQPSSKVSPTSFKGKTCIFTMSSYNTVDHGAHQQEDEDRWNKVADGLDAQLGDDSVVLRQVCAADYQNQILSTIKSAGCCQVVMLGHRGGDRSAGGISTGYYDPWRERERVLPDDEFQQKLNGQLKENGCQSNPLGCRILLYTCNRLRADDPTDEAGKNRQRIADATGCTVCGTSEFICLGCPGKGTGDADSPTACDFDPKTPQPECPVTCKTPQPKKR